MLSIIPDNIDTLSLNEKLAFWHVLIIQTLGRNSGRPNIHGLAWDPQGESFKNNSETFIYLSFLNVLMYTMVFHTSKCQNAHNKKIITTAILYTTNYYDWQAGR